MGVKGAVVLDRVVQAIADALFHVKGVDEQFRRLIEQASESGGDAEQRRKQLFQDEQSLARKRANVQELIALVGAKPMVLEAMT